MQAKSWHDAGFRNLSLAVNLSVTQLQQPDLVDRVREILQETSMKPELLELEITESSAMQSPGDERPHAVRAEEARDPHLARRLRHRPLIAELPEAIPDRHAEDRSVVRARHQPDDPDTAAIVTAIIAMAHSLRLKVIAEGVEFTEQAAFLKRYACDQMQGYLIKPPVPLPL